MHFQQAFADEEGEGFRVVDSPTFNETYAEMEKLLSTGKVKAIGVSNFSVKTLVSYVRCLFDQFIMLTQAHKVT